MKVADLLQTLKLRSYFLGSLLFFLSEYHAYYSLDIIHGLATYFLCSAAKLKDLKRSGAKWLSPFIAALSIIKGEFGMVKEALFGSLVSVFFNWLVPKQKAYETKNKEALSRVLLRLYPLIDAYLSESERLITVLSRWSEQDYTVETFGSLKQLTNLTEEFTAQLRENEYLQVFDSDLIAALRSTAIEEKARAPFLAPECEFQTSFVNIGMIDAASMIRFKSGGTSERILYHGNGKQN